jgi:hypothetical protein
MRLALVENYPPSVNPSSSDYAGSSPAAPNKITRISGFFYGGEQAKSLACV